MGTAGYCAYKWMSPTDRQEDHERLSAMAEDIGDVREDMSRMASTIKNTF